MNKKQPPGAKRITNRRARHDYDLADSFVAGLSLTGAETKSLRRGHGHLRGAYVTFKSNEPFLINATIASSSGINISETDQTRPRKLLLKQKEIEQLLVAKQQGRTIVPLELLTQGRYIKLRLAPGQGKKLYDKRQTLKARAEKRRIDRAVRQR